ncbi:MAG TPA: InlB B-repeat-containing protein [Oscillospiraceae bacterium]|nr:InlB B-repeat-containing protein [Oscillospiraceae bacterium]
MTIAAQWTINEYTMTFDSDGGSSLGSIIQNYGTPITAPVGPSREGYTFNGWLPDLPTTIPAENMTLQAQWTPINQEDVSATGENGPYFATGVSLLLAAAGISIVLRREKSKKEAIK